MHSTARMRKLMNEAAGVVLLLLTVTVPCRPQSGIRDIRGTVTDKSGNPLPGAVVQLENKLTLTVMSYITAKDGHYRFSGLSDNVDYTVRARYRKYWSPQRTLSKLDSSRHPQIDLVIPID